MSNEPSAVDYCRTSEKTVMRLLAVGINRVVPCSKDSDKSLISEIHGQGIRHDISLFY
ncbi:MAG: hypothetical protein ACW96X_08765 [Promethearchaeota archaeon]